MPKKQPSTQKSMITPQFFEGSILIAGQKIKIGSTKAVEGSSTTELVKSLKKAAGKELFPQAEAYFTH